jgi:hypothetical protein
MAAFDRDRAGRMVAARIRRDLDSDPPALLAVLTP